MDTIPCTCHNCRFPDQYAYVRFEDLPEDVDHEQLGHTYMDGIMVKKP